MVSYSPRAARALAFLKRPYNDVDIFVEDTGNHNMWLLIARALLPPEIHISSVNMLGGRDSVLAACKLDQSNTGRRKLYIIDGDFDFLLGKSKPKLKYLYRLRAYCIENLLISEGAMVQIALESNPLAGEHHISGQLRFDLLAEEIENRLRSLFILYATSYNLASHLQTVGYSVTNLFINDASGPIISPPKVVGRMRDLMKKVVLHAGATATRATRHVVADRASKLGIQQIVSGKDYIVPLVLSRFKARCGYRGSPESFKVALARYFSANSERHLARRLRNISA